MLHFDNVGLYDGLFVMQDRESKTLWNHITGEALYGPHVGRSLGPVGNILQMTVQEALEYDADMQVAISDRPYTGRSGVPGRGTLSEDARLMPMFIETLGEEDSRRPRMDMGLGIWTEQTRRYYPMEMIRARGPFIDEIDGRSALIFIESRSATPTAQRRRGTLLVSTREQSFVRVCSTTSKGIGWRPKGLSKSLLAGTAMR